MRFQFIICSVMRREAEFCAARSPNQINIVLLEQGLHNEPGRLRSEVQAALDKTTDETGKKYDASLLGYGLCSNGITGLSAEIPIVVPRGHDCITLLLGSKEKYREYFDSHRGVYWYSSGWIETGAMPGKEKYEKLLAEYEKKYGKDNARYLMEQEQKWIREYNWAAYIDWGFPNSKKEKKFTKKCAEYLGWQYDELKSDSGLMQRLVDGKWNTKEFLVVKPGEKIEAAVDEDGIINCRCGD
ncbi:MAG: DUF1638 domain-containing protein [Phycisphaerae bacterium]